MSGRFLTLPILVINAARIECNEVHSFALSHASEFFDVDCLIHEPPLLMSQSPIPFFAIPLLHSDYESGRLLPRLNTSFHV